MNKEESTTFTDNRLNDLVKRIEELENKIRDLEEYYD